MAAREPSSNTRGIAPENSSLSIEQEITNFVQMVNSEDSEVRLSGVLALRKLSSSEKHPPLKEIIDSGIIPKILELMGSNDVTLQYECAWLVLNVCSGTSEMVQYVISLGGLVIAANLLTSESPDCFDSAAWLIGNIAGDNIDHRNLCLHHGCVEKLVKGFEKFSEALSIKRNVIWAISNLIRGKPIPEWSLISPAMPVMKSVILYDQDQEILTDALWSISYMSGTSLFIRVAIHTLEKYIQEVIDMDVISHLIRYINPVRPMIAVPAIKTIANISARGDAQITVTQVLAILANPDFLPNLFSLLSSPKKAVRKEACSVIANIARGNREQIAMIIENSEYMGTLINLFFDSPMEIKIELSWCFGNLAIEGSSEQISYLVNKYNFMRCLVEMINFTNQKISVLGLKAVKSVLTSVSKEEGLDSCIEALLEQGVDNKIEEFVQSDDENDAKLANTVMKLLGKDLDIRRREKPSDAIKNEKQSNRNRKDQEEKDNN